MHGPLTGVRVVELAGQGPAPFACAILADFGADVVLIDRSPASGWEPDIPRKYDFYMRNKRSVALDLKSSEGMAMAKAMISRADVLVEGYRPGVVERLGLGPEPCLEINPRLVFARMTGWGQDGPYAQEAGHDINYLALTGALHSIGAAELPPPPPLNLVADLGGGGMFLVAGILMALLHARETGQGQVVDCAMLDGVSQLMSAFHAFRQRGSWSGRRQDNIVDGGAHYFGTYATKDGRFVSVGAMEPQFYANLLEALEIDPAQLPDRDDRSNWPFLRQRFAQVFAMRTRAEWQERMKGRDACFAPVLSIDEAWSHPQMQARGTFAEFGGLNYPAPAPRLSTTPGSLRNAAPEPGADTSAVLADWGIELTRKA
ncbi:CaiB/BaiF CoA transferase family protein [Mesorhizobium sp. L-8-3]|uniref:CaiB/BaiF CoA transferase family protein n=1 Tax=Mesorhizobium sp. L-8-3 TaxID=2744522 RepID=UPI001934D55D|nr:CaiB/BaiF CoA-transferase family protein [Mesorhizobium sp. L-8-3]BCH23442.1 CoA transferase [Mesorhizobium sp. L-8-3]